MHGCIPGQGLLLLVPSRCLLGACGMYQVPPCGHTENGLLQQQTSSSSSLHWLFLPSPFPGCLRGPAELGQKPYILNLKNSYRRSSPKCHVVSSSKSLPKASLCLHTGQKPWDGISTVTLPSFSQPHFLSVSFGCLTLSERSPGGAWPLFQL